MWDRCGKDLQSQGSQGINLWGSHISEVEGICNTIRYTRWWFQLFFISTPIWWRFPFWLMFFEWVGSTTNQIRKRYWRMLNTLLDATSTSPRWCVACNKVLWYPTCISMSWTLILTSTTAVWTYQLWFLGCRDWDFYRVLFARRCFVSWFKCDDFYMT